ncbi:hypothetical protein PsorP6_019494 [Peronosclerospora sorghi]|nr:hypothetical protein PsorP6_019494 [Peronosclerospora sorghi]
MFQKALEDLQKTQTKPKPSGTSGPIVFKLQYDPNGLPKSKLRSLIAADELEQVLKTPVKICYLKPPTLKTLLCPSKLPATAPSPAALLANRTHDGV